MKKSVFSITLLAFVLIGTASFAQACTLNASHANAAVITQKDSEVIVSGTINRGVASHLVPGAHVHVQLVDSKGKALGTAYQSLAPTTPKRDATQNYRAKYSVSFPAAQSSKASTVRVQYVGKSHGECESSPSEAHCQSC